MKYAFKPRMSLKDLAERLAALPMADRAMVDIASRNIAAGLESFAELGVVVSYYEGTACPMALRDLVHEIAPDAVE